MLTKGKFLELLKAVDPDPNFLVLIIKECFKMLPDAASWKLAHQLYINYFWDGTVYKLKNNLTGELGLVHSYIKPKFNITRSYREKLNDKYSKDDLAIVCGIYKKQVSM